MILQYNIRYMPSLNTILHIPCSAHIFTFTFYGNTLPLLVTVYGNSQLTSVHLRAFNTLYDISTSNKCLSIQVSGEMECGPRVHEIHYIRLLIYNDMQHGK